MTSKPLASICSRNRAGEHWLVALPGWSDRCGLCGAIFHELDGPPGAGRWHVELDSAAAAAFTVEVDKAAAGGVLCRGCSVSIDVPGIRSQSWQGARCQLCSRPTLRQPLPAGPLLQAAARRHADRAAAARLDEQEAEWLGNRGDNSVKAGAAPTPTKTKAAASPLGRLLEAATRGIDWLTAKIASSGTRGRK